MSGNTPSPPFEDSDVDDVGGSPLKSLQDQELLDFQSRKILNLEAQIQDLNAIVNRLRYLRNMHCTKENALVQVNKALEEDLIWHTVETIRASGLLDSDISISDTEDANPPRPNDRPTPKMLKRDIVPKDNQDTLKPGPRCIRYPESFQKEIKELGRCERCLEPGCQPFSTQKCRNSVHLDWYVVKFRIV